MEANTGNRDSIAGCTVDFDHLHIGIEVGVVDQIAIGFAVLTDEHIKRFEQLAAFPALNLLDGISAVGQVFRLSKAILIADEVITLGVLCVIIRACAIEIDGKLCTFLGSLNLRFTVIGVFDDGDIAFLDLLILLHGFAVVLGSIVLRIDTDLFITGSNKVALAAVQLLDRPVSSANIVFGGNLAVCIGDIGVDQLVTLVDAVLGTCQSSVALRRAGFHILLGNSQIPLFEVIIKTLVGDLIPLDSGSLIVGNHIADRSIDFFQRVARSNQNILESRHAAGIGHSVFVYGDSAVGGSVEVELHSLDKPVFSGLCNLEIAALKLVVKALVHDLVPFDSSRLIIGDDIAVRSADLFKCITGADQHIIKHGNAAGICDGILIHRQTAIGSAVQMKLHALDKPVLSGLRDFEIAATQRVIESYGRGFAADDGNSLSCLSLVFVIGKLRHRIGAGKKIKIDGSVLSGRYRFIDAVAGNRELDALNLAVLTGLYDVADALSLRVQLEIEKHRVFCARSHRLLARTAPDKHLAHAKICPLLCGDHHSIGNHVLTGEGVLIAAAGNGDAACGEVDVGQSVIGIRQRNAVVVLGLVILHRVGLSIALIAGREARHNIVLRHLIQNPVVALLSRTVLEGIIEQIRVYTVCRSAACGARSDLLLVFPDDALRRIDEVIDIRAYDRRRHIIMPPVHERHHNSVLCGNGQILKILAILSARAVVGVAVIVGHTGLDAVHMIVIACAVNHQILVSSETASVIDGIKTAVVIVEDDVTGLAVVVVSIRAEIQVSIGGSAFCAFLSRPCECSCGKHRNDHEDGKKRGEQPRALGFEKNIHLVFILSFW